MALSNRNRVRDPISFFIPTLQGGGAQRVVVNLVNSLTDLVDAPIHIVLVRAEGEFLGAVRPQVRIVDLRKQRTLRSVFALANYLRKERPQVVISSLHYANVCALVAKLLSLTRTRIVVREANVRSTFTTSRVQLMRISAMYRLADQVVANSSATRDSLVDLGAFRKDRITVIGNPIEPESNIAKEVELRFLGNWPFVCAVGRLTRQKGFDVLLDAFALIDDKSLHLVILGEGKLRMSLTRRAESLGIAERVHMPGFVSQPHAVLQRAALFVLSSRWEGFGNVLVEALGAGVPIVSTDCPGAPRDILEGGEHAHLVPPDNPQALADGINCSLKHPAGTYESRRQRAQAFAPRTIAREYLEKVIQKDGDYH